MGVIIKTNIIGYKLKDHCKIYALSACNIDGFVGFGMSIEKDGMITHFESIKRLEDAGVLNLWFYPVFGKLLPIINGVKGEKLSNSCVKYGDIVLSIDVLKKYIQYELISGDVKLKSITLSSNDEITIEQIKEIIDYFN